MYNFFWYCEKYLISIYILSCYYSCIIKRRYNSWKCYFFIQSTIFSEPIQKNLVFLLFIHLIITNQTPTNYNNKTKLNDINKIISLEQKMRSISLAQNMNTMPLADKLKSYSSTIQTITTQNVVGQKIKDKIKTYSSWNYRTALRIKKRKQQFNETLHQQFTGQVVNHSVKLKNQHTRLSKKKSAGYQELQGVKTQRRQRFKRTNFPSEILHHYKQNQGYQPTQEQQILINRLIQIRQKMQKIYPMDFKFLLQRIIKTLNIAVDFNQSKFFQLCILMAGQICLQAKQYKIAFYFYVQAMVTATCTVNYFMKLQAIKHLGIICIQTLQYEKAIIFLKKALQYAWKIRNVQKQLKIYDLIGKCYYYQGKTQQAFYYHNRYIQGQTEARQSAVRKISFQMLTQYQKTLDYGQKQNLTQLFLSYLRLPIYNFSIIPQYKLKNNTYINYVDGQSPRKSKYDRRINFDLLPELEVQIQKLLKQQQQFKTTIPNPDLHQNFISTRKYGRNKKDIQFQQSNIYHKIMKIQTKKVDKSVLKLPIDEKITQILNEKSNPHWWESFIAKSKKERNQKLGSIRQKIDRNHMSFLGFVSFFNDQKQAQQRKKRAESLKTQKIYHSINKTILDVIDPIK